MQNLHSSESKFGNESVSTPETHPLVIETGYMSMIKVPEPMDLLAKTVVLNDEPIKTGAAIAFINIERFTQGKRIEMEKLAQSNGVASV